MPLPDRAFDLHVHAAPDIEPRGYTDTQVVDAYEVANAAGVVLKNHYESTVGRAAVAGTGRRIAVYGGLALNSQVGGFNPAAVAAALLMGARIIWMPTQDARLQDDAQLPCLHDRVVGLARHRYAAPPVDPSSAADLREILRLIAEHDAVLATGHLGVAEIDWLLSEARDAKVRRMLVTHPSWVVPHATEEQAQRLAASGALLEITAYQLLGSHPVEADTLARFAKSVGLERIVLSSDAGQVTSPSPPVALGWLIDALADEGLDESALVRSATDLPRGLVEP